MKMVHILLIIILIFATILGIKIYNSKNPSEVSKNDGYSIYDIQKILKKSDSIENYEIKFDDPVTLVGYTTYKKKNNKIFLEGDAGLGDFKCYRDYDENIQILYFSSNYEKVYLESKLEDKPLSNSYYITAIDVEEFPRDFSKVRNAKEEKYKGINCLKVELELKNVEDGAVVLWINIENGLILKSKILDWGIREYEYKFNTVTDKDVNPDLTGYKKIIDE